MFCKIRKLFITFIIISLIGFVFYQKNSVHTLSNGDSEISTTISKPSILLFVDISKSGSVLSQETMVAFYYVAKANEMFKNYGVYSAIVANAATDANAEEVVKNLNYLKRHYKIEIDVFVDKNNKFAKKISTKGVNSVVLMKNNKVTYDTNDLKIRWFDIDGMKLVSKYLGISIGL